MATKKDFISKKKTQTISDPLRTKVTSDTKVTQSAIDTKVTSDGQEQKSERRFTARFTPSEWAYLEELKWQTRRPITEILQDYVRADMKKHPEILKTIDELNG